MGEWGRVEMSIRLSGSPFARDIAVQCKINIFLLRPSYVFLRIPLSSQ